jgi:hypothetical protein
MRTAPAPFSSSLINEHAATKFLGLAAGTLAVWRTRRSPNSPAYVRVGRAIRYRTVDLEKYVADRTITSSGTAAK